ncbi:uncharacterized protein LOC117575588 [Drosophila albomicans]|uniref:Uncharacterized protein LOC117575588 n=1 Tax=Drosophila albomicans TaxID=7291 RepID=A0A6P8XH34_DROAB|nr:uncharacterized protein LOC117575588 [Drosophila albomicans]
MEFTITIVAKTNTNTSCARQTNLAQYVRSNRGTDLVYYEGNTYTPNEKLREGQKSRDWKCSMYHKAKCRARLVTRITSQGDLIHVTSCRHTHQSMYMLQQQDSMDGLARNPLCTAIRQVKQEQSK